MKAALFSRAPYLGPAPRGVWPVPAEAYDSAVAERSMALCLEQFQLADELGFDWVTVAEHHYAPFSMSPNPMVLAGALSQCVRRARIALLGANLPTLNPVRVAEEFAMVDLLSGGRLVAGMLRGRANEKVTYGTNPAETRERFEEALQLIVRAWAEPQPFGWQGRYYEYRAISIWPRPVQQPHPPIYMSGSSPESGEFAARHRLSLGLAVTTLPLAGQAVAHYRQQAAQAGWQPGPDNILYRLAIHVAETDQQALNDLASSELGGRRVTLERSNAALFEAVGQAGYHGRDAASQRARGASLPLPARIAQGQLLAGSPDSVLEQIRSIQAQLGCGILDLNFEPVSPDKTLRAIELFGTRVLPRLRDL